MCYLNYTYKYEFGILIPQMFNEHVYIQPIRATCIESFLPSNRYNNTIEPQDIDSNLVMPLLRSQSQKKNPLDQHLLLKGSRPKKIIHFHLGSPNYQSFSYFF